MKSTESQPALVKLLALLCLALASGCAGGPRVAPAEIFIERPSINGDINVHPCTVKISSGQTAVVVGGENGLFIVPPGTYYLTAASSNPDPQATRDSDWISDPFEITVTSSQVLRMVVEPKGRGSTRVGGWVFRQQ